MDRRLLVLEIVGEKAQDILPIPDLESLIEEENLNPSPIAAFFQQDANLSIRFGEVVLDNEIRTMYYAFNTDEETTEYYTYYPDSRIRDKVKVQYDEQGNSEVNAYDANDNLRLKVIKQYNEQGKVLESSIFSADSQTLNFKYKYDEQDNMLEKIFYLTDNPISQTKYISLIHRVMYLKNPHILGMAI